MWRYAVLEDRKLIASTPNPLGGRVDLYDNPEATFIYVDGIGQITGANGVVKLALYRSIEISNAENVMIEKREVAHSLTMPSVSLYGFVTQLLPLLKDHIPALESQKQEIEKLIGTIKAQR